MAAVFGANTIDKIATTDAASIRLTEASLFTWLGWVYITTFTSGRRTMAKNAQDGNGGPNMILTGTTEFQGNFAASVVNATATSTGVSLALNTWYCLGMTFDPNAAQQIHLFVGSLTALMAEVAYAGGSTNIVGTSASLADLTIGNWSGTGLAFQGRIAHAAQFNRVLTLAEQQQWQFRPARPLTSGCVFLAIPGLVGTGTQPDYSGNGNTGAVTGATVGDHVPLGPMFGWRSQWRGAFRAAADLAGAPERTKLGVGTKLYQPDLKELMSLGLLGVALKNPRLTRRQLLGLPERTKLGEGQ